MKKLLLGLCRPVIRCFHNFGIIILFTVSIYCSGQSSDNYLEKVYLDIDKSHYLVNETIWFKAYLVDGRSNTKAKSEVLYVDLIDPASNIVTTKIIKISEAGGGAGEFQLSPKFVTGDYTIRAYTNYMRNFNNAYFFRKEIYIKGLKKAGDNILVTSEKDSSSKVNSSSNSTKKPDVQFLPESGVLVNEISNRVAFKVVNSNGESIFLKGVIKDHEGNKVSSFSTSKFGMGIFMFKPKKGANYKAYINYNGKDFEYPIPVAVDKGATMIVRNNTDQIHIVIQSTLLNGLNGLTLVGKQFGEVVTRKKLSNNEEWIIKLKTEKLKEGIVKFTLLDEMQRPLSERLVFVEKEVPLAKISIDSLKSDYKKRDLISFDLKVSDITNNPLTSNMSISVSEVENSTKPHQLNIKSQLLLESELKGTIENPSFYFKSKDANRLRYLDLLMLTQGWRKYAWSEMEKESTEAITYNIESGFNFKGSVSNFYNHKKKRATKLEISFINDDKISNYESKTKENGLFHLGEYDILDSTTVFISAKDFKLKNNKKMRNSFYITLDSVEPPVVSSKNLVKLLETNTYKNKSKSINEQLKYKKILKDYPTYAQFEEDSEQLDEVKLRSPKIDEEEIEIQVINAKLEEIRNEKRGFFYSPINTRTLVVDDLLFVPSGVNIMSLLYNIPGVSMMKQGNGYDRVTIRGKRARIRYNGRPLENSNINVINPLDVDFIDVNGSIINIYPRDGRSELLRDQRNNIKNFVRKGIINIEHPGYTKAKEFYSPVYNTADTDSDKPDYRSTLYWNPNLALNEDGRINVSFYTADLNSTYKIEVEGITKDGTPIVEESFITVK